MNRCFAIFFCAVVMILFSAGCETTGPAAAKRETGEGEMFEVKQEFTPFYRNGPQQRGGPDLSLKQNRLVKMLKRGFGFSLVELEDGTPGYVATEDLRPSAARDFAGPDDGLLGLAPEPLNSSAIVERYTIDPAQSGLQLGPAATGDLFLPPDAPLPDDGQGSAPQPTPLP